MASRKRRALKANKLVIPLLSLFLVLSALFFGYALVKSGVNWFPRATEELGGEVSGLSCGQVGQYASDSLTAIKGDKAPNGILFVLNSGSGNKVQKFNAADLSPQGAFDGDLPSGGGCLPIINGNSLAINHSNGRVYVLFGNSSRTVQWYDQNTNVCLGYLNDSELLGGRDIEIDNAGNFYVVKGQYIYKFNADGGGKVVFTDLERTSSTGLAIDGNGNMFVTGDRLPFPFLNKIHKYNNSGNYIGGYDYSLEIIDEATDIDYGTDGYLYVTDNRTDHGENGKVVQIKASNGAAGSQFAVQPPNYLSGVTFANGNIFVYNSNTCGTADVHKFYCTTTTPTPTPSPTVNPTPIPNACSFVRKWGTAGTGNGQFKNLQDVTVPYGTGFVYTLENGGTANPNNNRVQKFTNAGAFVTKWGSYGSGNGQFNNPQAIVGDGTYVYVSDKANNRVQKFTSEGSYLKSIGGYGTCAGKFSEPEGIAYYKYNQRLYVVDSVNYRVQMFTQNGDFIKMFGSQAPGVFLDRPKKIAVRGMTSSSGIVYVTAGNKLHLFNLEGVYQGTQDSIVGNDVAVDYSGPIVVPESQGDRVNFYNISPFRKIGIYGTYGSGNGQFIDPGSVGTLGRTGVYVGDTGNNRVQVLNCSLQ